MRPFRLALVAGLSIWIAILCLRQTSSSGARFSFNRQQILEIRAVAHEWCWEFDYPALGIKTSEALYVPSTTDVRLELVSADVIHSFRMIGMKEPVDIIPGRTQSLDLVVKSPGVLYGNCDSDCGCGTVCIRFRVLASAPRDFAQWMTRERSLPSEFNPRRASGTPACALDIDGNGHAGRESPASRLQQLLDAHEPAGNRAPTDFVI